MIGPTALHAAPLTRSSIRCAATDNPMSPDTDPVSLPAATTEVNIAPLTKHHWPAVERIYAAGIATGHATFEGRPPSWEEFDDGKLPEHRFVALAAAEHADASLPAGGRVLGWVAASAVSSRSVYAGVVKHSVYVDPEAAGHGVGGRLLRALVTSTEAADIWTIEAGVFPENTASLRLHQRAGFEVVGTRRRLGKMTYGPMAGQWRDVLLLERRSPLVG